MNKISYVLFAVFLICSNKLHSMDSQNRVEQIAEDLYFVLEPVTTENIGWWQGYFLVMKNLAHNRMDFTGDVIPKMQRIFDTVISDPSQEKLLKLKSLQNLTLLALQGFEVGLRAFGKESNQLWIAYLTPFPQAQGIEKMACIEMSMTVTSSPGIPIVTHLGIFRSPVRMLPSEYLRILIQYGQHKENSSDRLGKKIGDIARYLIGNPIVNHARIASELHKFAARHMLTLFPDKQFMITTPLDEMKKIFIERYGSENVKFINRIEEEEGRLIVKSGDILLVDFDASLLMGAPWVRDVTHLFDNKVDKFAVDLNLMAK